MIDTSNEARHMPDRTGGVEAPVHANTFARGGG